MLNSWFEEMPCHSCGNILEKGQWFCNICGRDRFAGIKKWEFLFGGISLSILLAVISSIAVLYIISAKPLFVNFFLPHIQTQSSPFVPLTTTPQSTPDLDILPQETLQASIPQATAMFPTENVVHPSDPKIFVRDYFNAVWQDRNYDYLWTLSTPSFQADASSGDYQDFVSWWESVDRVDILSVTVMSNDGHYASVDVHATFYLKDGRVLNNRNYSYDLIYDSNRQSWLFDYH